MNWWLDLFRRTKREYYADFFITGPVTIFVVVMSFMGNPFWTFMLYFWLGALIWTLYEYVVHRWVLHKMPLFKESHQLHHDDQTDYIAIHPGVTVAFYVMFWILFGFTTANPIMAGFSLAYLVYSIAHTMFHYARITPGHLLYGLKRNHAIHHRKNVNFGVTSPVWDHVFRTYEDFRNE